ncbi:MAG: STAS domain-containing protein [Eubacterium sp.]|nr:STAS domain-containing protein [Eubacterium sp.]
MIITKTTEGTSLTLVLEGRLDTVTAPQLESELRSSIDGIDKLFLDFTSLEYISSAGLRILLSTQKIMNKQGGMVIRNVNEDVMDIFEITGFVDILTVE